MPFVYLGGGIVALALGWKVLNEASELAKWGAVASVVWIGGKAFKVW